MNSLKFQHNKNKLLFKLNDNLFRQHLPNILDAKFQEKQNNSLALTVDDGFKLSPKKPLKFFNMPKRFKKHNNKVEDNINVMNKTSVDYHQSASKTCSSSFYKPVKQRQGQLSKTTLFSKHRSKVSLEQEPKKNLQPKTLQGIERYFDQKYNKKQQQNLTKQHKQIFRLKPRKISKQISQIFQENKHLYMLSRFTLLQLKSYYCALLNFSKGDIHKFKYSFEIMLNLANVTVRQNIMAECLKDLINGGITFAKFLKTFTNIQQKLRKQAIIDYFQILLEDIRKANITYEELTRTFQGRMKKQIASELTVLLYEKLNKDFNESISKKQIHTLCYENQQFCTKFYTLNNQNMLSNKFGNSPDY